MKKIFPLLISAILCCLTSYTQVNPIGRFLEEGQILLAPGSTTTPDATALGGTAMYRPVGSGGGTFWYGPYTSFQPGNYLVQIRLKVTSNAASSKLCILDVWSNTTGLLYASVEITPSMFRFSNDWQLFTLAVRIPPNATDIEIRGMDFKPEANTDLYLDYINIIPGDIRGFYSDELSISGTGKVGIGTAKTNDANYKLFVETGIRTRKVKVDQAAWPDYVFHSTYRLRPLSEVEQYIQQHQHLPEVLAAAVVQREGVDLGDNQATLLKKIEELTLYLIEQNKQIQDLKKQVSALQQKQNIIAPTLHSLSY